MKKIPILIITAFIFLCCSKNGAINPPASKKNQDSVLSLSPYETKFAGRWYIDSATDTAFDPSGQIYFLGHYPNTYSDPSFINFLSSYHLITDTLPDTLWCNDEIGLVNYSRFLEQGQYDSVVSWSANADSNQLQIGQNKFFVQDITYNKLRLYRTWIIDPYYNTRLGQVWYLHK